MGNSYLRAKLKHIYMVMKEYQLPIYLEKNIKVFLYKYEKTFNCILFRFIFCPTIDLSDKNKTYK